MLREKIVEMIEREDDDDEEGNISNGIKIGELNNEMKEEENVIVKKRMGRIDGDKEGSERIGEIGIGRDGVKEDRKKM